MNAVNEVFDEAVVERMAERRRVARGYRLAARRALGFARVYRTEEGPGGRRERACVAQALTWRAEAKSLQSRDASELARPGLARARPGVSADVAPESRRAK